MSDKCFLCEERDVEHPKSGLCKRCYAFLHYWQGRTVTDFVNRMKQIDMWKARGARMRNRFGRRKTI